MTGPFIEPDWPAPANVLAVTTTRAGGCSAAPFHSLNLAQHVGDEAAAVCANRDILAAALPATAAVQWLDQVHGSQVVRAGAAGPCPQADASWSAEPGRACAVLTADCLPVLMCSASGDVVAAAHAGWRGLLQGVLENTVAATGAAPSQLMAWLGPAISERAFEVGAEVRAAYLDGAPPDQVSATAACFVPNSANPGHFFANLYALARLRLREAGLDQVFGGNYCTFGDSRRFFSYRRDGHTGRMATVVMLIPA